MKPKLTIAMPHYKDYDGVYFTIQDIRKELQFSDYSNLLSEIQFVVVDNDPESNHSAPVKQLFTNDLGGWHKYVPFQRSVGTSNAKNKCFEEADGEFVLLMDCHVLLVPVVDTIQKLFRFMRKNPQTEDLYSGPLIYDNIYNYSTHFDDVWSSEMWGVWGNAWCRDGKCYSVLNNKGKGEIRELVSQEPIACVPFDYVGHEEVLEEQGYTKWGTINDVEPIEIPMNGCGILFCRKKAWLGFNQMFRGFGGEEGYIHEKYRKVGHKTMSLPFLRWLHRFNRPLGVPYPLNINDKINNHIIGGLELGLSMDRMKNHFVNESGRLTSDEWDQRVAEWDEKLKKSVKVVNKLPKVVAVCPSYKRYNFLDNASACFDMQTYPLENRLMYIVEDSGKVDDSLTDTNIRLERLERRMDNIWQKYNHAFEMNKDADIYAFWDDDDIYLPWHLEALTKYASLDKPQVYIPSHVFSTSPIESGEVIKESNSEMWFTGGMGINRKAVEVIGGFNEDETVYGWHDFFRRLKNNHVETVRIKNLQMPSYVYRLVRGEQHLFDLLTSDSEQNYQDVWDYYKYKPVIPHDIDSHLDTETIAIFRKFNIQTG